MRLLSDLLRSTNECGKHASSMLPPSRNLTLPREARITHATLRETSERKAFAHHVSCYGRLGHHNAVCHLLAAGALAAFLDPCAVVHAHWPLAPLPRFLAIFF